MKREQPHLPSQPTLVVSSVESRMVKCARCGVKLRSEQEQRHTRAWGIANTTQPIIVCAQCA